MDMSSRFCTRLDNAVGNVHGALGLNMVLENRPHSNLKGIVERYVGDHNFSHGFAPNHYR